MFWLRNKKIDNAILSGVLADLEALLMPSQRLILPSLFSSFCLSVINAIQMIRACVR